MVIFTNLLFSSFPAPTEENPPCPDIYIFPGALQSTLSDLKGKATNTPYLFLPTDMVIF